MQYNCMACSAKCSMCSMKCTDAVSGAFSGAGTVHNVHCAVGRVLFAVFYQLCRLSLVIPVLSLAIPSLSLAIPGLSLLVPSQFQDFPDSSCLAFYQQYIYSYNKLNILRTMI